MSKHIVVWEAIGDGTKDRGENHFILSLTKNSIDRVTTTYRVIESFPISDIVRVDCFRGDQIQSGDMASGAAAGLLLGGVGGAVVGGMLNSGQKKSWYTEIVLKDKTLLYRFNLESDKNTFVKWAQKTGLPFGSDESTEAVSTSTDASSASSQSTVSGADEIMKYKQLLDQGIITQEEFDAKKKQILGV